MEKIDELPNAENLKKTHDLMTLKTGSLFNEDLKKPHSNSFKSAIDSDIQATHFSASSEIESQEELQRLNMSPSKLKNQLLGTAMVKLLVRATNSVYKMNVIYRIRLKLIILVKRKIRWRLLIELKIPINL